MNKLHSYTGFFFSYMKRISITPSYVCVLDTRPLCTQYPNKVLNCSLPAVHHVRGITSETGSALEEKFKQADQIPNNFKLIYRSPMNTYVPYAQCVCSGSIILVLLGCGFSLFTTKLWAIDAEIVYFGSLLLGLNVSVLYLVLQYVMRIYVSDNDTYICVMPSVLPLRSLKIMYNIGDTKHVPPKGFLPWKFNKYKIGSKSVIILQHYFRRPADYNNMVSGHNKS